MNPQKLATVAGAAVTTFLIVGAGTIEAVTAALGGDIAPGIVGVIAGTVAGILTAAAVLLRWSRFGHGFRAGVLGYAAFGLALVFLAALSYVNVPGSDEYLGLPRNLVIAAIVAIAAAAATWRARDDSEHR